MEKKVTTRLIHVGTVSMGGDSPVTVQSMCDTDTRDWQATVRQIRSLEEWGCEIIRVAVPDMAAAETLGKIKSNISIPLVADIHFDYNLALEAIRQGVDKIRINPGNIGKKEKVEAVVNACKERGIPIRIGVNVGSIAKKLLEKYGPTPKAAVESCLEHVRILENLDFGDIAISVKFSKVPEMIIAYRMLAEKVPYPLHLGVTHAGMTRTATVKNAIGISTLLRENIGATLRVSITGPPEEEVKVGWDILKSLNIRKRGLDLTSCPTCGRKQMDVARYSMMVLERFEKITAPIEVAVMGCEVNGPGEAKEADIGIAGTTNGMAIFKKGEKTTSGKEEKILPIFFSEIEKLIKMREK